MPPKARLQPLRPRLALKAFPNDRAREPDFARLSARSPGSIQGSSKRLKLLFPAKSDRVVERCVQILHSVKSCCPKRASGAGNREGVRGFVFGRGCRTESRGSRSGAVLSPDRTAACQIFEHIGAKPRRELWTAPGSHPATRDWREDPSCWGLRAAGFGYLGTPGGTCLVELSGEACTPVLRGRCRLSGALPRGGPSLT